MARFCFAINGIDGMGWDGIHVAWAELLRSRVLDGLAGGRFINFRLSGRWWFGIAL